MFWNGPTAFCLLAHLEHQAHQLLIVIPAERVMRLVS